MTDLFLLYRDLLLPTPLWEEQGVYGGYRWISLDESDSIWISRKWEPYLVTYTELQSGALKLHCGCECMQQFKDMMHDASLLTSHTPSYLDLNVASSRALVTTSASKQYVKDFLYPELSQRDNQLKIQRLIQLQQSVAVAGYSSVAARITDELGITEVFSSSTLMGNEQLSEEDVVSLTSHMKVIIPREKTYLKQYVRNWANVITI